MALSIVSVSSATQELWQRIADACWYATFFHTPAWASVFSSTSRSRITPAARIVTFSDHNTALLTLCHHQRFAGLFSSTLSSPAGTYGGWTSADALDAEHGALLIKTLLSYPSIQWRENPFDPLSQECTLPQSIADFTQVIDLRQGLHAIEQRASAAHRKALNKARREGVTISTATTLTEWQEHYRLYQQNAARWQKINLGTSQHRPYSWDLFKSIFDLNSPACKLWQAKHADKTIASILCFYHNHHAVTWHGVADASSLNLRPNNLLYDAIMQDALAKNYWWMDFNPSGGHAGVLEFKSNLGAVKLRSNFISRSSGLGSLVRKLRG